MQVITNLHYGNWKEKYLQHIYVILLNVSEKWSLTKYCSKILEDKEHTIRAMTFCNWVFGIRMNSYSVLVPQSELKYI